MNVIKVVLAVAAIVLGVLALAGATLFDLSPVKEVALGTACAGGAVLL